MPCPVTVFLDFKSPYAYLAVEPTRRMAAELNITIDWMPFVLDIPSYLGSARLDDTGALAEHSRSAVQWSMVKYAYNDCRRYARLGGLSIRGTVKIWDTTLAAIGMLWAKRHGDHVLQRYIDGIYRPFWKRELDVEDLAAIEAVLVEAGAHTPGFREYCTGEGAADNQRIQSRAFDRGIFGVPTYVVNDELYFGREHLPRIRWLLQGQHGPCPDVAYELLPGHRLEPVAERVLHVGLRLADAESLLCIQPVLSMAAELGLELVWYALPGDPSRTDPEPADDSRGARHRRYRAQNLALDRQRYLPPAAAHESLERVVSALLREHDVRLQTGPMPPANFDIASAPGYVSSPVFLLGGQSFVGRQHLPLIKALAGAPGPAALRA